MSTIGEVAPGSFDSYEGIRIVIPGLIVFAACIGTFKTLAPGEELGLLDDPIVGLVGALVLGLFLYFWDIPARAASYGENQPTDYLEGKYPHVNPSELLTAYLLALNTKMPINTRSRSLYMGSMYRIGMEMVVALGLASTLAFAASLFEYGRQDELTGHWPRITAAASLVAAYLLGVIINQGYERRSAERSREAMSRLGRSMWIDIARPSIYLYGLGAILIVLPNLTFVIDHTPARFRQVGAAIGLGLCFGHWAYMYVRGFQKDRATPRKRRRMHSATAGALLMIPLAISLVTYDPGPSDVLGSVNRLVAWTAVAALVVFSVVVRGHERKLHGVYRGQTRWLAENPEAMRDVLPG
jgi:uncharacterized membrane protein YeaQ/YmgE (transglycosylase-associated protein family)